MTCRRTPCSFPQILPPEASRAGCAPFARRGETRGLRRKALQLITVLIPIRDAGQPGTSPPPGGKGPGEVGRQRKEANP